MKYESPKINIIELDIVDIIQTSGNVVVGGGGENETPFNPVTLGLDTNY